MRIPNRRRHSEALSPEDQHVHIPIQKHRHVPVQIPVERPVEARIIARTVEPFIIQRGMSIPAYLSQRS